MFHVTPSHAAVECCSKQERKSSNIHTLKTKAENFNQEYIVKQYHTIHHPYSHYVSDHECISTSVHALFTGYGCVSASVDSAIYVSTSMDLH